MQFTLRCLLFAVCVVATLAVPSQQYDYRQRRYAYPARAMMFSGFYRGNHPQHSFSHYVPRNYEPEGAMTAISAGTFYGNGQQAADCGQCNGNYPGAPEDTTNGPPPEVIPTTNEGQPPYPGEAPVYPEGGNGNGQPLPEDIPIGTEAPVEPEQDIPEEIPQETADPSPPPTNGKGYGNGNGNGNGHGNGNGNGNGHANGNGNGRGNGAKIPKKPRYDEESDEEDDGNLPGLFPPGKKGRGRGNFYNTYFPIVFGSHPGARNGAGGEGVPGVATAIANSFSTGRGAVATSHATAYGGPHYLGSNGSRKGNSRRPSSSSNSS